MDCALAEAGQHSAVTEDDAFERAIVGKHRENCVALTSVCDFRREARTLVNQRLRLRRRAVVHDDFMFSFE